MEQLVSASLPSGGSFGALLRAGRHRACLSQEQLAAHAGLSERGVRNLEAGRVRSPRPDPVRLLADALQLSRPERDSLVAAAQWARGGPGGAVAGGAARASPGLGVRFIAVVAEARSAPSRRAALWVVTVTAASATTSRPAGVEVTGVRAPGATMAVRDVPVALLLLGASIGALVRAADRAE